MLINILKYVHKNSTNIYSILFLTTGKEIQADRLEAQEDPRSEEEAEQDPGGQGDRQGGQENEEQPGQGVRRQSLKDIKKFLVNKIY